MNYREDFNTNKLTHLTGTLCKAMDIPAPKHSEGVLDDLYEYIMQNTSNAPLDRVLMYNPDAIGEWTYLKYQDKFDKVKKYAPYEEKLLTVFPPKTPVCFGSMYTGASPEIHGIQSYTKPVIKIDSIFDALIRSGKKPCIVAVKNSSMARIFNERDMDYYIEDYDNEVIARTLEIIKEDKYDFIAVYNQEFDDVMHRSHPNSKRSQKAIDHYSASMEMLGSAIEEHWQNHNSLIGYAPDHGTHREWYLLGQHGKNIPMDMNISHFYGVIKKAEK